jgi:aconitate hydratase
MNFIGSPEIVIVLALGGRLSFNPFTEELTARDGTKFRLDPPRIAPEVPEEGFENAASGYVAPSDDSDYVDVLISKDSDRLQKLEAFTQWDRKDFLNLLIVSKVKGKCTTDHISPAGAWLMYRGHLDKISDNLLLGAVNAYTGEVGTGKNILNGKIESFPHIAREYKQKGFKWIIIGDQNYGEGSSREHAAMTPRYLGCAAVIAKSFARIHETNLKKQGVLALTFADPMDYSKIMEDDRISIIGLNNLQPGMSVVCILNHADGRHEEISLRHSYNESQLGWFRAGSALNILHSTERAN